MTRAGGADDLYKESLRPAPIYKRFGGGGDGDTGHWRRHNRNKEGGDTKTKTKFDPCADRRDTRTGRALVCQPPAAPAASSSPCSTLSCRTFSDLVGCHQAAPQAAGGGTAAAPLSCGLRQQQHLQP